MIRYKAGIFLDFYPSLHVFNEVKIRKSAGVFVDVAAAVGRN